ncbi:MAG TPA: hypothetical protein VF701_12780 [Thermoanaerobaculia bacterium]
MKYLLRVMAVSAFALLLAAPAAIAQTPEVSTFPVTEPIDVGGTILQPGTYAIRVVQNFSNRSTIQVTSPDLQTVYATVLTVPHHVVRGARPDNTTFVFYPPEDGQPRALRTWFAQDSSASQGGHDIVYDERRARQLARLSDAPVVYADTTVTELDRRELSVITPQNRVETYVYTPPPAPMASATRVETVQVAEARPISMPRTASRLPLLALLGMVSILGAVAIRMTRVG